MSYPIIQPPPTTLPSAAQAVDRMIGEVAALVGGDDDLDIRTKALAFLDRAVDRLNMKGIWLVQRTENAYSALTNGQQTLAFPSDWGFPDDRSFAYNADNQLIKVIEWRAWEHFRGFISDTDSTHYSVPDYLSIKSDLSESLIYVWPFIDTSKVSKIIVPYFKRIQTLSEATSFSATNEIREALISYAEYLIMRYRYKDKPAIWLPFERDADRVADKAMKAARRMEMGIHVSAVPDFEGNLAAPFQSFAPGTVFIAI